MCSSDLLNCLPRGPVTGHEVGEGVFAVVVFLIRDEVKFTIKIRIFDEHLNEVLRVTEEYFLLLVNPGRL